MWLQPAAAAPIRILAWELLYALGATLKKKQKERRIPAPRILEVACLLPPIGPSQILPVSLQGSTLILIRGPAVRPLMQAAIVWLGQGGQCQSVVPLCHEAV